MGEKHPCPVCGKLTSGEYCRATKACNAARSRALYNRRKGDKPACLVCGLPLRKRGAWLHTGCRTGTRAILIARLAADMRQLEARREAEREQAGRATYAARKARERAAKAAGATAFQRERWLAQTRAGTACPVCGREIGRNGGCWMSAGCIDASISLVLLNYDPTQLYKAA